MGKKIVPDTSILIQRKLSDLIKAGKLKKAEILIPKAAIDELQAQASRGRDIGFQGLEEIKEIRKIAKPKGITIKFKGGRPTLEEIQLAKKGRIDALIRDVAAKEGAVLYTGDYVQALVGEAEGVDVHYVPKPVKKRIKLESLFRPNMQSLHLKVGVPPMAKIGRPGEVKLIKLKHKTSSEDEIKAIINEVMSKARTEEQAFIEIGKAGVTVVQLGNFRISIARPPFSDGLELTAVRPIAKVKLSEYALHDELKGRLVEGSKGVLIAGPPGSGKTSFASAVAEFLFEQGKVVKTFELPRDLQVGPEITEYAPLEGDWAKTADILLLVRPDYTIFDEIRKTPDFRVFSDMRLAGVGMVGVIHSTDPVSAIQRFIGRIELGMIPHVIDTVIFIQAGKIHRVFELGLVVKVPTGMTEADLARPVVEVRDFGTRKLEFEIYAYGAENVIVPVRKGRESPVNRLAKELVYQEVQQFDPKAEVEVLDQNRVAVRVRTDVMPRLIGRGGKNIERLEKKLGLSISVEPSEGTLKQGIPWEFEESGAFVSLWVKKALVGQRVDLYIGDEFLMSSHVGKRGLIKVRKRTELGRKLLAAVASRKLRIFV